MEYQYDQRPISKGRLNKMLKYFKGKNVIVSYEYNNSMGVSEERHYKGEYDDFKIEELLYSTGNILYRIKLFKDKKCVLEQDFEDHADFCGLGKIAECNSGPYCYFQIKLN